MGKSSTGMAVERSVADAGLRSSQPDRVASALWTESARWSASTLGYDDVHWCERCWDDGVSSSGEEEGMQNGRIVEKLRQTSALLGGGGTRETPRLG